MKKIWSLLTAHARQDLHPWYYASVILFLAASITVNYTVGVELWMDVQAGLWRIVYYLIFNSIAYFGGAALMILFKKRRDLLSSKRFWLLSWCGVTVISIQNGFPYLSSILNRISIEPTLRIWVHQVASNSLGILFVWIPFIVLQLVVVRSENPYGLRLRGIDLRPYVMLLLCVVPWVALASFTKDFVSYYPTYQSGNASSVNGSAWVPMIIYEFFYGLDFFNVELVFRGFLVIALSVVMGKDAIIPMVTTYCFLHFGKPIGETISAIFGGYVLGVIAYYTRSIWGGVLMHIGVAWSMELAAGLQKL